MTPENTSKFFEGSIHLIYAVVAAQGFFLTDKIFIPISNLYNYQGMLSAFALSFVYFFLTAAWFGFFKSVQEFPHLEKKISIIRYGVGLLNTFVLYYMVSLTSTSRGTDFGGIFSLLPIFFALLVMAHTLKFVEYDHYGSSKNKKEQASRKHLANTTIITAFVCGIFVLQLALYIYVIPHLSELKWNDTPAWNPIFIISSIIVTAWYRWHMLKRYSKQMRKTTKLRKGTES